MIHSLYVLPLATSLYGKILNNAWEMLSAINTIFGKMSKKLENALFLQEIGVH